MKTTLICLIAAIGSLSSASLLAGESGSHHYRSEVAGMMCSACAAKVKAAFSSLEGVKTVKIKAGKDGAAPTVELVSSSEELTRADAVKALGEDAKTFVVQTFERQD